MFRDLEDLHAFSPLQTLQNLRHMLGDGLMMFSHFSRCFRMFLDVYMSLKCFVDVRIDFHVNCSEVHDF